MFNYICEIKCEKTTNIDGETAITYSLILSGDYCQIFPDLCTDKERVQKLVHILNETKPCPSSIPDVIDDLLFNI